MPKNNHNKFPKSFLIAIVFLSSSLTLIGFIVFITEKEAMLGDKKESLISINALKSDQISDWMHDWVGDAKVIFANK